MRASLSGLLGVLAACAGGAPRSKRSDVAMPLPALTLPTVAGGTWDAASAHGNVLVIDVMASWCKPCSKAFPKLDALAARRTDIAVVAISIDEDPTALRAFLTEFPLTITVAQDVEQVMTRPPLGIARLPTVLIVDATGTIRHRIDEPTERDYDELEPLLAR